MQRFRQSTKRSNRGVSIVLLVIALAIVQLAVDFFVFNLVRILMIQRQVTGICEAAAITGTSILAKLDVANDDIHHTKLATAQKAACRCAENMLLRGYIAGQLNNKAVNVSELAELGKNIKPDSCQYVVTIADPDANYASVSFGDLNGKTISCFIAYGYRPIFLGFLNNVSYAITGSCVSGLPQIDTVLVLDLSASMDDQTAVTFVRREWIHSSLGAGNYAAGNVDPYNPNSGGCGIVQYVSLNCPALPHTLANYLAWDSASASQTDDSEVLDGSLVNVLPPQNLDKAQNEPHGAITHPMYFDAYLRSHYSHYDSKIRYLPWEATQSPYCRACDYGSPPGNCDLSVGLGGNGDAVTDMAGNYATPPGPGSRINPQMGKPGASPSQSPPISYQACPQINAFGDLTWLNDGNNYFAYQPAAPGALHGPAENDPVPSPDQQTFTDLVVNIANPLQASSNSGQASSGGIYEQPLNGPDYFMGFSYTFPDSESDLLLRGQTFNFPNIAVVVEAARGNLENTAGLPNGLRNGQAALIDRPVSVDGTIFDMRSIEPKDGYQRAYQRLAMMYTQPLASVLTAIDQGFIQKMHKFADCRFGFVAFSSAGSLADSEGKHTHTFGTLNDKSDPLTDDRSFYIYTSPYGDPTFANAVYDSSMATASGLNDRPVQDGSGFGFRIPRIGLDVNAENYLEIISKNKLPQESASGEKVNVYLNSGNGNNGIYNCRPQSLTDSGEALQTAHHMFHSDSYNLSENNKCRRAASKLIVFFTDGEPTGGIRSKEAQTMLQVAGQGNGNTNGNTCEGDGTAIIAVSLNLAKGKTYNKLKEHQSILLDEKQPEPGQSGGIVWRAEHGGRYYACDNLSQLKSIFSEIARRFSQGQR